MNRSALRPPHSSSAENPSKASTRSRLASTIALADTAMRCRSRWMCASSALRCSHSSLKRSNATRLPMRLARWRGHSQAIAGPAPRSWRAGPRRSAAMSPRQPAPPLRRCGSRTGRGRRDPRRTGRSAPSCRRRPAPPAPRPHPAPRTRTGRQKLVRRTVSVPGPVLRRHRRESWASRRQGHRSRDPAKDLPRHRPRRHP